MRTIKSIFGVARKTNGIKIRRELYVKIKRRVPDKFPSNKSHKVGSNKNKVIVACLLLFKLSLFKVLLFGCINMHT